MNADQETRHAVRAWLQDGVSELPAKVRLDVRAVIATTPQDTRWIGTPSRTLRPALLAAAFALAAVAAIALVWPLGPDSPSVGGPSPTPSESPAPPSRALTLRLPSVPLPESGRLPSGTYSFANPVSGVGCTVGCSDYTEVVFPLPDGWVARSNLVAKHLDQPDEVAISIWTVDRVYADPCHWQASPLSELDIVADHHHDATGPIVVAADAGGLSNQVGRGASPMTAVELAGHHTLRLELSVPADLDVATCDRGQYRSWTDWTSPNRANAHHAPGQTDVIYMIDVDRRALVIDASHRAASTSADVAELKEILELMRVYR